MTIKIHHLLTVTIVMSKRSLKIRDHVSLASSTLGDARLVHCTDPCAKFNFRDIRLTRKLIPVAKFNNFAIFDNNNIILYLYSYLPSRCGNPMVYTPLVTPVPMLVNCWMIGNDVGVSLCATTRITLQEWVRVTCAPGPLIVK